MWRQWLPYLLVLILVPVLTFGVVKYFASDSDTEPVPTADETVEPSEPEEEPVPEDGAEDEGTGAEGDAGEDGETTDPEDDDADPGDEANDETDEPQDLKYDTHVLVLNGAQIQGFAGDVADALAESGWQSTEADNYTNDAPTETTLYYTSEEFEEEARAVGEELGITSLVESASSASNGIVIVLRPDYSLPTGP